MRRGIPTTSTLPPRHRAQLRAAPKSCSRSRRRAGGRHQRGLCEHCQRFLRPKKPTPGSSTVPKAQAFRQIIEQPRFSQRAVLLSRQSRPPAISARLLGIRPPHLLLRYGDIAAPARKEFRINQSRLGGDFAAMISDGLSVLTDIERHHHPSTFAPRRRDQLIVWLVHKIPPPGCSGGRLKRCAACGVRRERGRRVVQPAAPFTPCHLCIGACGRSLSGDAPPSIPPQAGDHATRPLNNGGIVGIACLFVAQCRMTTPNSAELMHGSVPDLEFQSADRADDR